MSEGRRPASTPLGSSTWLLSDVLLMQNAAPTVVEEEVVVVLAAEVTDTNCSPSSLHRSSDRSDVVLRLRLFTNVFRVFQGFRPSLAGDRTQDHTLRLALSAWNFATMASSSGRRFEPGCFSVRLGMKGTSAGALVMPVI